MSKVKGLTGEIEVRIELHGSDSKYYLLRWRPKKSINIFNSWRDIESVSGYGSSMSWDQPCLSSDFDSMVEYGKKLKGNPQLIQEHYDEQEKIWNRNIATSNQHYKSRDKSITL